MHLRYCHPPSQLHVKFVFTVRLYLYKEKVHTDLLETKRRTTRANTLLSPLSPAHVGPNPDGGDAKAQGESTYKATIETSFLTI